MTKKHFLLLPAMALALSANASILADNPAISSNTSIEVEENAKKRYTLNGHVLDAETGEHIPFATVMIAGTNHVTLCDEHGHFTITRVPEGHYTITAKYVGYSANSKEIDVAEAMERRITLSLETSTLAAEEVVVTANRYATKKREAAVVVNVMGDKTFENRAAVTPAEVLDFQPGLRMEYNCGNCGVPQLRINGLEGQYSQVLLDGRAIFSSLGMVYGLEQMPTSMIERVEVIRGGGSALYGANAIGGIVNIITKEPTRSSFEISNQTMSMGWVAPDITTSINGSIVSDDLRTGLSIFGMIRDRKEYDRNGDSFSEIPMLGNETIGLRGYQKIGSSSKITIEYHRINEDRRGGNMFDRPAHEADIAEQLAHQINTGSIAWDFVKGNNTVSVYTGLQQIYRDSYFGAGQDLNAYGNTEDLTVNSGAQWNHSFEKLWFMPATLTLGADFKYNNLHDQMLGYGRNLKQITNAAGFFAQNDWTNDKWTILLGARIDKHNLIDKPIVSPRATLRFAANDDISLRAGYARGYRAPQAYDEDLHVEAVGGAVSLIQLAPGLKPEYSNTLNLSFDYFKQLNNWQVNFMVEGFFTQLTDVFALRELGYDAEGNLLLERYNASGAEVAGINFETRASFKRTLDIQAGFTIQQSKYTENVSWSDNPALTSQDRMFRSPDNYGYLTVDYRPWERFLVNTSLVYTGSMLVQHAAGYIAEDSQTTTQEFYDLGIRLAYDIPLKSDLNLEISGGVKNIFDQFQPDLDAGLDKDAGYIYGPVLPRSFFVGVKFSF